MGQSQSDSNIHRNRSPNPAISASGLSSEPSTSVRRPSVRRLSRLHAKLPRRMTEKSLSLNRRSRAVRRSISGFARSRIESETMPVPAQVNGGNTPAQAEIPEISSHRSAWRRSIGFVKSRRSYKASDHSIQNDNDAANLSSNADAPIPEALAASSSSHTPLSLPMFDVDPVHAASHSDNHLLNSDTADHNSLDPPTATPSLPYSSLTSEMHTSTTHHEQSTSIPPSHAEVATSVTTETEASDPVVVIEESIPISDPSNSAHTDAVSQLATDGEEPNVNSAASETTSNSPRQFPPSGTLVVVQGVVHTTDVQLHSNSSPLSLSQTQNSPTTPEIPHNPNDQRTDGRVASSTSPGPRARLSALLRRSHGSSSRPGSSSGSESTGLANEDVQQPEPSESSDGTSTSQPAPSQPHSNAPGSISSNSIDVLGTLLSVAAAATAASLLTGPQSPTPSTETTPINPANAQTLSSPASLGSDAPPSISFSSSYPSPSTPPPAAPSNPTSTNSVGDRDRAEGIRQLLSSIRNRLGRRLGPPFSRRPDPEPQSQLSESSNNSATSANGSTTDPGPAADTQNAQERMLNEIARAFNLGFSSTPSPSVNDGTTGSNQEGGTGRVAEENLNIGLPSEGTFERFLLDLQVDLRSVLTGGESANPTTSRDQDPQAENIPSQNDRTPESVPEREVEPDSAPEHDSDQNSIPSLQDVSDSDSDSDSISDSDSDSNHSASSSNDSLGFVSPANETGQHRPTGNETQTPNDSPSLQPRINYWRLHRFPAIPIARAYAAADNVAQNMRSGLGGLTRRATMTSPVPTRSSSTSNGTETGSSSMPATASNPSSPTASDAENQSVVVPVIVVGLQSVNPFWFTEPLGIPRTPNGNTTPNLADEPLRSSPTPSTSSAGSTLQDTGSSPPSTSTSHTVTPEQGTRVSPPPPGLGLPFPLPDSRTFLIYVIGGYYPPDHDLVTGAGDPTGESSFEALILLNELLNRLPFETSVTVSKEQLDKSGLEVIKGRQVQEWVNTGKVRSNCLDQCLICLEEYQEDESVRVLECQHAFHMDCVDRWLLEGRNSCPACRGKGVSEGNEVRSL
ncbi:hypothetical protein FB446DRAFT_756703 [Lentinula raphanica]|nr:hypothetical protein FB446DRAFT_756703 [Lentinula raphanica]